MCHHYAPNQGRFLPGGSDCSVWQRLRPHSRLPRSACSPPAARIRMRIANRDARVRLPVDLGRNDSRARHGRHRSGPWHPSQSDQQSDPRIYRLIPAARNRINTVFMVTYFVGGALGTFLAGFARSRSQWNGVCALGTSFFAAALIIWVQEAGSQRAERGVPGDPRSGRLFFATRLLCRKT